MILVDLMPSNPLDFLKGSLSENKITEVYNVIGAKFADFSIVGSRICNLGFHDLCNGFDRKFNGTHHLR